MKHPYIEFEKTRLWITVDEAITVLQKNRDLELATTKEHIVGYICQQLAQQRMVDGAALISTAK